MVTVEKQREVVVSCSCLHSALFFFDREAPLPKTIRCSVCGTRGAVTDFVARARRLPPDALILLADRPA
jgi:hypothetical protein